MDRMPRMGGGGGGISGLLPRPVWYVIGFAIFMALLPQLVTEAISYMRELSLQAERLVDALVTEVESRAWKLALGMGLLGAGMHFSPWVRHHQRGAVFVERAVLGVALVSALPTAFRVGHHWIPILIEALGQRLGG